MTTLPRPPVKSLSSSAQIPVSSKDDNQQLSKPLPPPPKKSLPPQPTPPVKDEPPIVDNANRALPVPKKALQPVKNSASEPLPTKSTPPSFNPPTPPSIKKSDVLNEGKPNPIPISRQDSTKDSAEICSSCKKPFALNERKVSAVGHLYHTACYICSICEKPFENQFTIKNDQPYHVECYKQFRNSSIGQYSVPLPPAPKEAQSPKPPTKAISNFAIPPKSKSTEVPIDFPKSEPQRAKSPPPVNSPLSPTAPVKGAQRPLSPEPKLPTKVIIQNEIVRPKNTTAPFKKTTEPPSLQSSSSYNKMQHSASDSSFPVGNAPKKLVIPNNIASMQIPLKRATMEIATSPVPATPPPYGGRPTPTKSSITSPTQIPVASPTSPTQRADYLARQGQRKQYSSVELPSPSYESRNSSTLSSSQSLMVSGTTSSGSSSAPGTDPTNSSSDKQSQLNVFENEKIKQIGKKVKLWGGIAQKNIMTKMGEIKTKVEEIKKEVEKEKENRERNKEEIRKAIGYQDSDLKVFPGIRAKTVKAINDGVINVQAGEILYITDLKLPPPSAQKDDDKKGEKATNTSAMLASASKGGGVGVWVACIKGKQSYIPAQCVELIEFSGERSLEKFDPLLDLLCAGDMTVALALCSIVTKEEFSQITKPLVNLFVNQGTILEFLGLLIEHEVELNGEDSGTLFRSNSVSSAIMSVYFLQESGAYLQGLLDPIFTMLASYPATLEVDPAKVAPENLEQNQNDLTSVLRSFLDSVLQSLDLVPKTLRNICYLLASGVKKRFPDAVHIAVGGFFFLRGITAAIVAPEGYGVKDSHGIMNEHRRTLVLLSKIVQSISNGKALKESFMESFNYLIDEYSQPLKDFFDSLSCDFYGDVTPPGTKTSLECVEKDQVFKIHQQLSLNLSKIGFHVEDTMADFVKTLDYQPYEALVTIMSNLGSPEKF